MIIISSKSANFRVFILLRFSNKNESRTYFILKNCFAVNFAVNFIFQKTLIKAHATLKNVPKLLKLATLWKWFPRWALLRCLNFVSYDAGTYFKICVQIFIKETLKRYQHQSVVYNVEFERKLSSLTLVQESYQYNVNHLQEIFERELNLNKNIHLKFLLKKVRKFKCFKFENKS